ncbi:MAG: hypothetical protein ABMA26_24470, partial [Limisphaerales bacterium]
SVSARNRRCSIALKSRFAAMPTNIAGTRLLSLYYASLNKLRSGYATQSMTQVDRVLKMDAAGRVWTLREQREVVLDEFERRGLPAAKSAQH